MIKLIIYIIIIIITGTGAYFFGFNNGREKEILNQISQVSKQTKNQAKSDMTIKKDSGTINPDNQSADQLSSNSSQDTTNFDGTEEYTVQENDTLFTIGLKFDILWTHIAKLNGIDENTSLVIGQKLKIPASNTSSENISAGESVRSLEIDQTKTEEEQKKVNNESIDIWRKDPIEVVRHEAPAEFNLVPGDPYLLVASDLNKGSATIFLQKNEKSYTFSLIQPVDKGENGIWKIEKIVINKNLNE